MRKFQACFEEVADLTARDSRDKFAVASEIEFVCVTMMLDDDDRSVRAAG